MEEIKTMTGLVSAYYRKHPNGHYFDSQTLKFFGERLSEMRLLKEKARVKDVCDEYHTCYVVSSLQRKHPCGPRRKYTYFDVETLDDVMV